MLVRRVVVSLLVCITSTCYAASFNCTASTTVVERRVCENPALSSLDDRLAVVYAAALKEGLEDKRGQRLWLKERNACTEDACIQRLYESRIEQLELLQSGKVAAGSAVNELAVATAPAATPAPVPVTALAEVTVSSPPASPSVPVGSVTPVNEQAAPRQEAAESSLPVQAVAPAEIQTAEMGDLGVDRSLKSEVADYLHENKGYLMLGFGLVAFVMFKGYQKKCPKCQSWFSAREVDRTLLNQRHQNRTVTRQDKHRDIQGKLLSTVERKEQVRVEVSTWKNFYVCKKCQHEWTGVTSTESS